MYEGSSQSQVRLNQQRQSQKMQRQEAWEMGLDENMDEANNEEKRQQVAELIHQNQERIQRLAMEEQKQEQEMSHLMNDSSILTDKNLIGGGSKQPPIANQLSQMLDSSDKYQGMSLERKESIKAQVDNLNTIFGDQELLQDIPDIVTMSELDEIDPQDTTPANLKFFEAASGFVDTVDMQGYLMITQRKGIKLEEQLHKILREVVLNSEKELMNIRRCLRLRMKEVVEGQEAFDFQSLDKNNSRLHYGLQLREGQSLGINSDNSSKLQQSSIHDHENKYLPYSTKFMSYVDTLIEKHFDMETHRNLGDKIYEVYEAVMLEFLATSQKEAIYLLKEMVKLVGEFELDNDDFFQGIGGLKQHLRNNKRSEIQPGAMDQGDTSSRISDSLSSSQSELESEKDELSSGVRVDQFGQTAINIGRQLLSMQRTRVTDIALTKEELAYRFFNYIVFKLAVIFERVNLYQQNVVQPRDISLNVIEVNLDPTELKMSLDGERLMHIWEQNDFIMTYQVLQFINKEIGRIEDRNIDRSFFYQTISNMIGSQTQQQQPRFSNPYSVKNKNQNQSESARIVVADKQNKKKDEGERGQWRQVCHKYFLQNEQPLASQAQQIYLNSWVKFIENTLHAKKRTIERLQSMDHEIFLQFNVKVNKKIIQTSENLSFFRSFQLELMYDSNQPISHKLRQPLLPEPQKYAEVSAASAAKAAEGKLLNPNFGGATLDEQIYKYLFLQIPFKALIGSDVFMIIKVFRNYPSEAMTELSQIWSPQGQIVHHHPNESLSKFWNAVPSKTYKILEGYSLVNLSDVFWRENVHCGDLITQKVKIYNLDPNMVLEDKFVQIYKDQREQSVNKDLTSQFDMGVSYQIMSSLAPYQDQLDLQNETIVMSKRFMNTLKKQRQINSSDFLKNDPNTDFESSTAEQQIILNKKLQLYMFNINEIRIDLHHLHYYALGLATQNLVRIQLFLRRRGNPCFQSLYSTISEREKRYISYQTSLCTRNDRKVQIKESCFLRIPTADHSALKDFFVIICIQYPILACNYPLKNNAENPKAHEQMLKIGKENQITAAMIQKYPHFVTFKTEYVQEIPIFDTGFESIIKDDPFKQITFLKFNPEQFSVYNNDPFGGMAKEKGIQLSLGTSLMSQIFTHEQNLNRILSLFSKTNGKVGDSELRMILDCVKNMKPNIKLFNVEKLFDILFDIFQQTTGKSGSSLALEAILNLFQSVLKTKSRSSKIASQLRILSDYMQRKFSNKDERCLYPKMLFQMIEFAEQLHESLKQGKIVGSVKKHFALFRYLPLICALIVKSFVKGEERKQQVENNRRREEKREEKKQSYEHRNSTQKKSIRPGLKSTNHKNQQSAGESKLPKRISVRPNTQSKSITGSKGVGGGRPESSGTEQMFNEFNRAEDRGDFDLQEGPADSFHVGTIEEAANMSLEDDQQKQVYQKDLTVVYEDAIEEVKMERSVSMASQEEMSTYFEGINKDFDSDMHSETNESMSRKSEKIIIGQSQRDFKDQLGANNNAAGESTENKDSALNTSSHASIDFKASTKNKIELEESGPEGVIKQKLQINQQKANFEDHTEIKVVDAVQTDFDELLDNVDYRQSVRSGANVELGTKGGFKGNARYQKLPLFEGPEFKAENLLRRDSLSESEFSKCIEIFLEKVSSCVHYAINKSCFALRMIYYKNLCGIFEQLVPYMSAEFILHILSFILKPLSNMDQNNLQIEDELAKEPENKVSNRQSVAFIQVKKNTPDNIIGSLDSPFDSSFLGAVGGFLGSKTPGGTGRDSSTLSSQGGAAGSSTAQSESSGHTRVLNYLSQENFWVSALVYTDETNQNEFVRRVITLGQFLESKAIEKLPNNPSLGRIISRNIGKFMSESAADLNLTSKKTGYSKFISKNIKAHTLLYIMHQVFKHENRFAQLYDMAGNAQNQNDSAFKKSPATDMLNRFGDQMQTSIQKYRESSDLRSQLGEMNGESFSTPTRIKNNYSIHLSTYNQQQDEINKVIQGLQWEEQGSSERLAYFIRDADVYTSYLLEINEEQGDENLPNEIKSALSPVKEKCQLIIFQLLCLLNKQALNSFIDRKKQLRTLLQNLIRILIQDNLEFRAPLELFGGIKKLKVFERFIENLISVMTSDRNISRILASKDVYRPITSAVWLIQMLIFSKLLKPFSDQLQHKVSLGTYKMATWNIFASIKRFWSHFGQKKRLLMLTENNEKIFQQLFNTQIMNYVRAEAKVDMFETLSCCLQIVLLLDQEYFKPKKSITAATEQTRQILCIQTVYTQFASILNENCTLYFAEHKQFEKQENYETILGCMIREQIEQFMSQERRPEYRDRLRSVLKAFLEIERRIMLLIVSEVYPDPLYKAFALFEQLKIFYNQKLQIKTELFKKPLKQYTKILRQIQSNMMAKDEDDDGILLDKLFFNQNSANGSGSAAQTNKMIDINNNFNEDARKHLVTELAFIEVKETEHLERLFLSGTLELGSGKIELETRVEQMVKACNSLRQNRFFLLALELKEREKNLLIQSFQYDTGGNSGGKSSQASMSQAYNSINVFNTLREEELIHQDIKNFRNSVKKFCEYFFIQFFGEELPNELKHENGFILRTPQSLHTQSLEGDLQALYDDRITFIQEDRVLPSPDCPGIKIYLEKVSPFTIQKRKRFKISDKETSISPTKGNTGKQKYPAEFKEYFKQNFKRQFFTVARAPSDELKQNFQSEANSYFYEVKQENLGELSKEEASQFYAGLHDSIYGRKVSVQDYEKFWRKFSEKKRLNVDGNCDRDTMIAAVTEEYTNSTISLQDQQITVYEVAEDFPTFFFMQKIDKKLVTRITGVEQEINKWDKRIRRHQKMRSRVKFNYDLIKRPQIWEEMSDFYRKVGPSLLALRDVIRGDIDADEQGGVAVILDLFFPNEISMKQLCSRNEERGRNYLKLFNTIENWFLNVQGSLILFEMYVSDFDEFQRMTQPGQKQTTDTSVNYFSKYNQQKTYFDRVRIRCKIDNLLVDLEDPAEIEESD